MAAMPDPRDIPGQVPHPARDPIPHQPVDPVPDQPVDPDPERPSEPVLPPRERGTPVQEPPQRDQNP